MNPGLLIARYNDKKSLYPVTIKQLADETGTDYFVLVARLRGHVKPHVIPAIEAQAHHLDISQYLVDYHNLTINCTLIQLANAFCYDNTGNVRRAIDKNPYYVPYRRSKDTSRIPVVRFCWRPTVAVKQKLEILKEQGKVYYPELNKLIQKFITAAGLPDKDYNYAHKHAIPIKLYEETNEMIANYRKSVRATRTQIINSAIEKYL